MKTLRNIITNLTNRIDFNLNTNVKTYIYLTTFATVVVAVALHIGLS